MVRTLKCSKCTRTVENVGDLAAKVTCSYCTMMMTGLPEETKSAYKSTGRPVGWHWMNEFVDKDGNVYHKGKEQPKLFGTLKPTKVVVKKKAKRRTQDEILVTMYKEKVALKKAVEKQKDFLNHKFEG
jgi:hypothetical protein|tara:strand:- start:463 stop:846 length:384 start_codon:yes stop_codon:yes gene_type:complete